VSEDRQFQVVSVERGQPGELEKYCDQLVREGYEPAGGLAVAGDRLLQAMWRRQDEVDLESLARERATEEDSDGDT